MITLKKQSFWIIIASFVLGMIATMLLCVNGSKGALLNSSENDDRVVSGLISNAIDNSFLRPITVSETLSKEYVTKEILSARSEAEAKAMEDYASEYLKSIRDGFGYTLVFAVSDPSRAYFTCNGISRFVDPDKDPADIWYKNFLEIQAPYSLSVDTDELSNWALTVFINTAVYDENNRLIGVCGVGVDMQELQKLLERYERIYDIKIDLINRDGLIQVDTDASRILTDTIRIDGLDDCSDGECYYEILPHGSRTIIYLENLDWYLVIQNDRGRMEQIGDILMPSLVCLGICLVILLVALKFGIVKAIGDEPANETGSGSNEDS